MTDVGIVIVNYRTRMLLLDCLRSIFTSEGIETPRVVVVDNASGDGSPEALAELFPQVEVIAQPENRGYAFANNLGLRQLGFHAEAGRDPEPTAPAYALLLNPDTLLPPRALAEMVEFMEARSGAGAAGPRLLRADGSLDRACRRSFPSPEVSFYRMTGLSSLFPKHRRFGRYNLTFIDDTETVEVDSVVGAFMLMRRDALADVGLLDESFFMYGEDLDLAYRIKQAGWRIWYHGAVSVLHYKGSSSRQRSRESVRHFHEAMRIFHEKHYAAISPAPLNGLILLGIVARYWLEVVRNMIRPRERRGVGSAT